MQSIFWKRHYYYQFHHFASSSLIIFILVTSSLLIINVDCQRQRQNQNNFRLVQRDKIVSHEEDSKQEESYMPVLPLCCNMVNDDVISYQCQNTLGTSSQEVIFKRRSWIAPRHLVSTRRASKFKFVSTSPICKYDTFSATLPLTTGSAVPLSLKQSRSSYFSLDGYFKYQNEYYRPDEYCVSGLNDNRIEVQLCKANCSDPWTPCIQKCCGMNQIYSFGYGDNPRGCVDVGSNKPKWFPTLYHDLDTKLSPEDLSALNPHIVHTFPTTFKFNCRFNKTTVFPHGPGISDFLTALTHKTFRNLEFRLRKDGWLLYPGGEQHKGSVEAKRIDNYCVDGAQDYGESKEFENHEEETVLFLCSGGVDEAFETPIVHSPINQNQHISKQTGTNLRASLSKIMEMQHTRPSAPPSTPITRPSSTSLPTFSTTRPPLKQDHLNQFKDRIDLDLGDSSASTSVEIEIEDGVPLNSLAMDDVEDGRNQESEKFIPAVLKVAVQVPPNPQPVIPGLLQTTFNHNNLHDAENNHKTDGSEIVFRRENKSPFGLTIPTCCNFDSNVNDGLTHHCRNRRMSEKEHNETSRPISNINSEKPIQWMVPEYFTSRGKGSSFGLRLNPLKCGIGKFQFQGFIHSFEQVKAKTSGEKRHGILSDAYLKYDNEFYSPDQYCVNGLSTRIIEVLICKPDCSMWETPCIKKCCGMDEIYSLGFNSGNRGCQPLRPNDSKFSPTLYKTMTLPVSKEEMNGVAPHFVQKYPPNFQKSCFNKITLAFPFSQEVAEKLTPANSAERGGTAFKHLKFRFRKDGKLMYSYPDSDGTAFDTIFDRGEFCVDAVRDYGEREHFHNNENQTILFICASAPHSTEFDSSN